jgi:hypothetical protein
MATTAYMAGRKRYQRPQGILWSENPGTLINEAYIPTGYEIGANPSGSQAGQLDQFLILSDHNRGEINISPIRIEERKRTVNGRMRSYHIADKLQISWNWTNLPSRAYSGFADFNSSGISPLKDQDTEYTSDGGAGGAEILDWYENHKGPFWMFLSYDKYTSFDQNAFIQLQKYSQIVQVYITDFNYSIVKRGGNTHDLWNISVTVEEA